MLRVVALVVGALLLASCKTQTTHPSPPPAALEPTPPAPVVAAKPAASPAKKMPAVKPPPPPAPSPFATVDSQSLAQEETRMKLAMAKNGTDTVATPEIGYYLDVLMGRLKQVATKDIAITRNGDRITLNISGAFEAGIGNLQIDATLQQRLAPIAKVLSEYRETLIAIHTTADESIDAANDAQNSERRSIVVAQYLVKTGIAGKRILIAGAGTHAGAPDQTDAAGRARVELQLEPVDRGPNR